MERIIDLDEALPANAGGLELALEDRGWRTLTMSASIDFSLHGLKQAARVCRVLAVAHPLVVRAVGLRAGYVFGDGVQPTAATGGQQDIAAFLHDWWDRNDTTLTGDEAQETNERALATDGNLFFTCFTNPHTGQVTVRKIPFDEITEQITNPDDAQDVWFYQREWDTNTVTVIDGHTQTLTRHQTAFYPRLGYTPRLRPKTIDGHLVAWDAPVLHVRVNALDSWQWGIGDIYAAAPWARAYRDFLSDWATLVKALSQFAWQLTGKGSRSQQAREAMQRTRFPGPDGNQDTVGATVGLRDGLKLEAIPKTGATVDSESGRPLAAMIAAALNVPVTMLLADPGTTGARATAQTLDEPLYRAMKQRQAIWGNTLRRLADYAVLQAVKAPAGPLRGTITVDQATNTTRYQLAGMDNGAQIGFDFPSLDDLPLDTLMAAIVQADATGKVPPLVILKQILKALRVEDADAVVESVTDEDGNWVDPVVSAGSAAVAAFRQGNDPASALNSFRTALANTSTGTDAGGV